MTLRFDDSWGRVHNTKIVCPSCNGKIIFYNKESDNDVYRCLICGLQWQDYPEKYGEVDEAQEWHSFDPDC